LKLVPYPSSPEAVAAILPTISNQQLRAALVKYGEERWDPARIDGEIARIAAWARKHNVYVVNKVNGRAVLDPETVAALGLKPSG
jgi:hypothetical protein